MQIYAIHKTSEAKVEDVMAEMKKMGAPEIRYAETALGALALEGCHRLEAAARLEIDPEFIEMDLEDVIEDHGLQDHEGEVMTVAQIVEVVGVPTGKFYEF